MKIKIRELLNPLILNDEWVGFMGDSEYVNEEGKLIFGYWCFHEVDELAKKYNCENFLKYLNNPKFYSFTKANDGHVYYMSGVNPETVGAGWFIRQDWLDKLGLEAPTTVDEYYNVLNNPFRGPSNNRAIRLDIEDNTVEIISNLDINSYIIRYVSRPNPIILTELPIDLSINGKNQITSCDLNPALHRQILERAVRLALISQSYSADKK
jgi:hypothetical protein